MPELQPEAILFGGAGVISLLAFTVLILVPAMGSFGRKWEKAAAAVLSLILLIALAAIGVAIGLGIIYFWDDISDLF